MISILVNLLIPMSLIAQAETNLQRLETKLAESEVPVLIDFTADWCTYCADMDASIHRIEKKYAGKANVIQINIDSDPEIGKSYLIHGADGGATLPQIRLYARKEWKNFMGFMNAKEIVTELDQALGVVTPIETCEPVPTTTTLAELSGHILYFKESFVVPKKSFQHSMRGGKVVDGDFLYDEWERWKERKIDSFRPSASIAFERSPKPKFNAKADVDFKGKSFQVSRALSPGLFPTASRNQPEYVETRLRFSDKDFPGLAGFSLMAYQPDRHSLTIEDLDEALGGSITFYKPTFSGTCEQAAIKQ